MSSVEHSAVIMCDLFFSPFFTVILVFTDYAQ